MTIRKIGVFALAAVAFVGASVSASVPASARGFGHGGGGFHGGGFHGGGFGGRGFGIGAGVATGLALGAYGYGYGYPGYAYNGYYGNGYYGGGCWVQHRVVYRYGHRVLVPVQVCG